MQTSKIKAKGALGKLVITLFKIIFVLVNLVFNIDVIYYIAYAIFAFIGVYKHPFAFAFHLTEIIVRVCYGRVDFCLDTISDIEIC